MKKVENDATTKIAVAAVIAIIILVAATFVFKPHVQQNANANATPRITPSPNASTRPLTVPLSYKETYDYGKYLLSTQRETQPRDANGVSTDSQTITTNSQQPLAASLFEVFPETSADEVSTKALAGSEGSGEWLSPRHLSVYPSLIQLTQMELGGEGRTAFVSASSRKTDFSSKPPVRILFAGRELDDNEKNRLLPALKKIAELKLNAEQSRDFETAVNDAFATMTKHDNPFDQYLELLNSFADQVHDEENEIEQEVAQGKPRRELDVSKLQLRAPSAPNLPNAQQVNRVLSQVKPITLKVSEAAPRRSKTVYLATQYLGTLLKKIEGAAAPYLRVSYSQSGSGYLITVSADVSKAMKNPRTKEIQAIPFDSSGGEIVFWVSRFPTETSNLSVTIQVEHVDVASLEDEVETDVPPELPAPTPTPVGYKPKITARLQDFEVATDTSEPFVAGEDCLRDAARVVALAEEYAASGEPPDDCSCCKGAACACTASVILRDSGVVPGMQQENVADNLYTKAKEIGREVSGASETPDVSDLIPGDLVFSKTYPGRTHTRISHVGIYVGNGQIIEASTHVKTKDVVGTYSGPYYCRDEYKSGGSMCRDTICCEYDTENEGIPKYQGAVRVIPSCLTSAGGAADTTKTSSGGLRGKKIFIAPGHDKNTVGATTKDGKVRELEVNLEDSLILRDILRGMGATVELSRETNDVALQPPEIAAKSNAFGADMFIGIHHDSRSDDPQGAGHILIYYRNLNGCDARCEEDKKLANLAIGSLENLGGKEKSRGIVGDKVRDATQGLVQLEQANAPVAVIVEVNQIDDPRVTQESYQKQAMQIIADAVEEYFGASAPVAASSLKPGWCGVLDNDVGEHGIAAYNKKFNQPDLTWEQVLEQGASGRATKEILCGILHVESHGNAFSHSSAGAMCGLQVMPPYMENYPNPYCSTFSDNSVAASVCGKWPAWHGTGELAPYNAYPTAEDGASDPKSVFHPLNCVKAAVQEFNLWYDRCEKSAQLRNEGETLEHCAIRHYGPAGSTTYVAMVEDWVGKAKEGIA